MANVYSPNRTRVTTAAKADGERGQKMAHVAPRAVALGTCPQAPLHVLAKATLTQVAKKEPLLRPGRRELDRLQQHSPLRELGEGAGTALGMSSQAHLHDSPPFTRLALYGREKRGFCVYSRVISVS
jgi:hypothetical protein